jgi:hypothetical protein
MGVRAFAPPVGPLAPRLSLPAAAAQLVAPWPVAVKRPVSHKDPGPAGFAMEPQPAPLAPAQFYRSPADEAREFSLYPVWLPALFALSERTASLRLAVCSNGLVPNRPAVGSLTPELADGPGFSGLLQWPVPGAVYWDFRETWSPIGVIEAAGEPTVSNMSSASNPWDAALRYWSAVPAKPRVVAIAVALIVPALFYTPLMFGPNGDVAASSLRWEEFKTAVRERATVDVHEDFHSGLGAWSGAEGSTGAWSVDRVGSAHPGRLALLRESIPLVNYRLEFLGQIESKALSFAFRAADLRNYQAAKLVVVRPGPLPALALVRYTVINGVEGPHTQTALTMEARNDTIYKMGVAVEGDHFTVTVNGQLAGAWTDDRLQSGGVGFFADKGEAAWLRGVHLVDKEDLLGRICYQVSQWTADRRTIGEKDE